MKFFMSFLAFLFLTSQSFAQDQVNDPNVKPAMRTYMGATSTEKTQKAETQKREPSVKIWLPPEFQSSEEKWPLLVFSHGFRGCAMQSLWLTQYLADSGYIVIAPDHEDANCRSYTDGLASKLQAWRSNKSFRPEKPFRKPDMWTDKTEADRRDDLLFAVSSMLDDRQYKNYIDTDKMGLIGHSLGGYTVLGLAGAWPSWKDKRFKAVLVFSPFATPYYPTHGIAKINIPVMYQGGTKDIDVTPNVKKTAYAQAKAPKYLVELDGAGHYASTLRDKGYESIINQTALAFFDKYVKGTEDVEILPEGVKIPKVRTYWREEGKASVVTP